MPLLLDPTATDDDLQLWGGKTTNLMLLNKPKFQWALQIYNQMREFFWVPQKVDLTGDVNDYNNLLSQEQRAFNGIFSYLIYLDSTQEAMLPYIGNTMTAPAVRHCIAEQAFFEGIHSESYKYVVEALLPVEERDKIYEFWRSDKTLYSRCENILSHYQRYLDSPTDENYLYALFADYLLEGLYFYNGFVYFYTLSSRQLMGGTADIVKLINRDEQVHVRLFQKLLAEGMATFPHSKDKLYEMVDSAVQQEIEWTNHITEGGILGISETSTANYTKHLADLRLRAIALAPMYGSPQNPYKHLEKVADLGGEAGTKANFFETTVSSYMMASTIQGWDDF
jgi:ribonucleoside-diphosphate reductase beta chain